MLTRLIISWLSVFASRPRCVSRSLRSRQAFLDCVASICTQAPLFEREAEAWLFATPGQLFSVASEQLDHGNRCREYVLGPAGWSGDLSKPRKFDANFVGTRGGLLEVPCSSFTLFTIRHELQHEIQRAGGAHDGLADDLGIGFNLEIDANESALLFLATAGVLRWWLPWCSSWYLRATAWLCAASGLAVLALVLAVCIPVLGVCGVWPDVGLFVATFVVCALLLLEVFKSYF